MNAENADFVNFQGRSASICVNLRPNVKFVGQSESRLQIRETGVSGLDAIEATLSDEVTAQVPVTCVSRFW